MTVVGTTNTYGLSLFFIPLTTQFGWSRAALSGALFPGPLGERLNRPAGGLPGGPLWASQDDALGRALDCSRLLSAVSPGRHHRLHRLGRPYSFYTIYVLGITLGSSLGTGMAANTAVANWFIRRRGTALGILSAGVGIGAGLWVPVIGMVLARTSWEQASVLRAFLVLIVGIPAAFVMRHRPEDYGYLPDGETAPAEDATAANSERTPARPRVVEEEFTVRQALSTPRFLGAGVLVRYASDGHQRRDAPSCAAAQRHGAESLGSSLCLERAGYPEHHRAHRARGISGTASIRRWSIRRPCWCSL